MADGSDRMALPVYPDSVQGRMHIDLRSDTVTKPSAGMRQAMADAEVGDDVFSDDPTANRLQAVAAERFGHETSLFFPSGTQANLAAMLTHCQRGDAVLLGERAHTCRDEGGGAAVLGSIQPIALPQAIDGSIGLDVIRAAAHADDDHTAPAKLLAFENTFGGRAAPQKWVEEALELAKTLSLATHLDGARVFNAAMMLQVNPRELIAPFDSASVCLSKGLGAPIGSLLLGTKPFIREARRWRKMLGGGMRQLGVLAAAGLYALENNIPRLAEDHDRARKLANGLRDLPGLSVEAPQTNMVWVHVPPNLAPVFCERLAKHGVLATGTSLVRFVTHLDITDDDIKKAIKGVEAVVTE